MKPLSFQFFVETGRAFKAVILRFPLALISASAFVYIAGFRNEDHALLAATGLGLPLFILASFLSETLALRGSPWRWLPAPAAVAMLVLYGITCHQHFSSDFHATFFVRLATLLLIIHLAIAILPPLVARLDEKAVWEFNKTLLSRFLITAFYSAVFFIGTALALVSIKELFGVRIDDDFFFRVWLFFAFFFNTALFLGGVPRISELRNEHVEVPVWIQFLCKYILLPLVVLYFGILYLYLLKIAFQWNWPDGMVGYPVFVLSVIGGFTALLMWPLSGKQSQIPWARTFWHYYFPLILPLSLVLLMALNRRIGDYGFTELRYSGLVLAIWLFGISVYYTIRRQSSFRMIPISLCGTLLICMTGPLSPRHFGKQSQQNRLEAILISEGWLTDGVLTHSPHAIPSAEYDQMLSMISYLRDYYGVQPFQNWIEQLPDEFPELPGWDKENLSAYQFGRAIALHVGATPLPTPDSPRYINLNLENETKFEFGRAGQFYSTQLHRYSGYKGLEIELDESTVILKHVNNGQQLAVYDDKSEMIDQVEFTEWLAENGIGSSHPYHDYSPKSAEELSLSLHLGSHGGALHILIKHAQFRFEDGKWRLDSGHLFVFAPAKDSG